MSTWYCENCDKHYRSNGVARHRAMHRDRKELVFFWTDTHIITYDYREEQK